MPPWWYGNRQQHGRQRHCEAGDDAEVVALHDGGSGSGGLVVGDSATNGMSFVASSTLTATATSTENAAIRQSRHLGRRQLGWGLELVH